MINNGIVKDLPVLVKDGIEIEGIPSPKTMNVEVAEPFTLGVNTWHRRRVGLERRKLQECHKSD